MKSPRVASSSPTGLCSDSVSRPNAMISSTLARGHLQRQADLLAGRVPAQRLGQLAADPGDLGDELGHVHGHADGAALVGQRALQRLADPPGGVGRELVALGVVELLDRADQTEVALLDQVEQVEATALVALGQRHDQAQVGLEQVPLGAVAVADDLGQVALDRRRELEALLGDLAQLLAAEQAGLDALGEVDLLDGGQQRDPADLAEVGLDQVDAGRRLVERERLVLLGDDDHGDLLAVLVELGRHDGRRDNGVDDLPGCRLADPGGQGAGWRHPGRSVGR